MQSLHDQSPAVSPEPAALQAIRYRPVAEVSPWLALPESLKALPEMAFCASPDGRLCAYNDQWLVGTGMHNAAGMWNDWTQAAHEEDRPALWALWFASLADGRALEETLRLRRADGRFGWVTARARAVRDTDGAVSYWLGTAVDIDAIKVSAEQAKMVAEEMAHRNGNLLAVVTSMLVLSARERPEAAEFARSTRSRLLALTRAHDLLWSLEGMGEAAPQQLQALLKMLLRPYASAGGPSIEISGGDGHVGKSTATCLALMVHELATNALKHGALSCPNGRLKVRIRLTAERLSLVWHESGGPELGHVPDQQGFGTALIDRVTRGGQASRVRRWWRRDGLVIGLWLRLVPQNRECSTA